MRKVVIRIDKLRKGRFLGGFGGIGVEIKVNGQRPDRDSKLCKFTGGMLGETFDNFQDGIKELPIILRYEFGGDREIEILFCGGGEEYEELKDIIEDAVEKEVIRATIKRVTKSGK